MSGNPEETPVALSEAELQVLAKTYKKADAEAEALTQQAIVDGVYDEEEEKGRDEARKKRQSDLYAQNDAVKLSSIPYDAARAAANSAPRAGRNARQRRSAERSAEYHRHIDAGELTPLRDIFPLSTDAVPTNTENSYQGVLRRIDAGEVRLPRDIFPLSKDAVPTNTENTENTENINQGVLGGNKTSKVSRRKRNHGSQKYRRKKKKTKKINIRKKRRVPRSRRNKAKS